MKTKIRAISRYSLDYIMSYDTPINYFGLLISIVILF